MKKTVLLLIFPLILALNSKAQLSFIDSSKNEIAITINPFMDVFGISTNDDFMTLQYKHHFYDITLRLGVTGIGSNTYDDAGLNNYSFKQTDSFTLINHFYDEQNSIRLNIGLEKEEMMKNNWKFYYGMDLLGGFNTEEKRLETSTFKLQADSSFKHYNTDNDSVISSREYMLLGMAFVGGFDYFFSKRISVGFQGYFPVCYEFQTGNINNKSGRVSFDQKISILIKMHF